MNTTLQAISETTTHVDGAMHPEIIEDFDVLRSMSSSWSRLWSNSRSASIFQSLPWISAWWKAFGKHLALCTPVVYQGSDIVGILPLVRCGSALRFIGTPGSDYCDILCDEGQAPQIIEAALRAIFKMDGWHTCKLTNLRDDSAFLRYSRDLPMDIARYMHTESYTQRSSLVLDGDRNAVIDAVRRKSALRRHRNKLYKTGSVHFFHLEDREQIHGCLNTLFQQHIGRRAMENEASQFLTPEWREFYHAMVDELNPGNELRFSVLELDGRSIACHFGFEWRGSLTLYKSTFDVDVWDLSPGSVLLSEILAYAHERQLDEIDFTVGMESYKEHFTNQTRDMYCTVLCRPDWLADICRTLQALQRCVRGCVATTHLKSGPVHVLHRLQERYRESLAAVSLQRISKPGVIYIHAPQSPKSEITCARPARQAVFSEITTMAMQYPKSLNASTLQLYLARLHRGDRCYVLGNDGCACVGWVRNLTMSMTSETPGAVKHLAELLYDLCPLSDTPSDVMSRELVKWFVWHAEQNGSLACVRVPRSKIALRKILTHSGFELRSDAQWVQEQ